MMAATEEAEVSSLRGDDDDDDAQSSHQPGISDYTLLEFLGEGATAQVYLAEHTDSHERVAIKVVDKLLVRRAQLERKVRQEMVLHALLRHPHVVRVLEVFEDARNYYMVLELCARGSLAAIVKKLPGRRMDEPRAKQIFRAVVDGVVYLHASGVIHRDLKLANLLLTTDGDVKVSDFGLATRQSDEHATMCGTPNFIAPEVLDSDGAPYSEAVDVWSMGCILHCLLLGRAPYEGRKVSETLENVANAAHNPLTFPEGFSASAGDLIKRMLTSDPARRPTAQQILLHPWLREQAHRRPPMPSNRRKSVTSLSRRVSSGSPKDKVRKNRRDSPAPLTDDESLLSSSSVSGFLRDPKTKKRNQGRESQGNRLSARRRSLAPTFMGNGSGDSTNASDDDSSISLFDVGYSDLSDLSTSAVLDPHKAAEAKAQSEQEELQLHAPGSTESTLVVSVVLRLELEDFPFLGLRANEGASPKSAKAAVEWRCVEPSEVGKPPLFTLKVANGIEAQYHPASGTLTATTTEGEVLRYSIPGAQASPADIATTEASSLSPSPPRSSQVSRLLPLVRLCQCLALRAMQLRRIALREASSKLPLVHYDILPEPLLASFRYRTKLASSSPDTLLQMLALSESVAGSRIDGVSSPTRSTATIHGSVEIAGVGHGEISATGDLRVVFLDGAQLTLAASGLQLRFRPSWASSDATETRDDVFELLTGSNMSAFLPSAVKQKLESVPEFIRRLKTAN